MSARCRHARFAVFFLVLLLLLIVSAAVGVARAGALTFTPKTDYATGQTDYSVAVGDFFDGDGAADVVTANADAWGSVSMLLGDGDGGFYPERYIANRSGSGAVSIAMGDFNADGIQDMAVANESDNSVTVLVCWADGGISGHWEGAGNCPSGVAVGDFNGDGRQDLAVSDYLGNCVSVLLGNGDGSFAARVPYPTGNGPQSVAVGDFNGDGRQDLAVANGDANTVSVLLGNGSGGFAAGTPYATGASPIALAVGDVDGDHRQDIVTANQGGHSVSVLLGYGDGSFRAKADYNTGAGPRSVAIADLDNDGRQDLAVANSNDNTVSVLLGRGMGGGFDSQVVFATGTYPCDVAVADFNGDGEQDLVTANTSAGTVSVLLNATYPPRGTMTINGGAPWTGSTTVTIDSSVTYAAEMRFREPGYAWSPWQSYGSTATWTMRSGDGVHTVQAQYRNLAGSLLLSDTIALDTTAPTTTDDAPAGWRTSGVTLHLMPTDGPGSGVASRQFELNGATSWSAGGGVLDVPLDTDGIYTFLYHSTDAVGNAEESHACTVKIDATPPLTLQSGADGAWHRSPVTVLFLASDATSGVASTQYSTDAGANWTTAPGVTISAEGVTTLWYRSTDVAGNTEPYHVADVMLDLTPPTTSDDAPVGWQNSSPVTVHLTAGDSSLARVDYGAGSGPTAVAAGDLNSDGNLDMAVTNQDSSDVSILLGDGSGGFAAHVDYPVDSGPYSVAFADFNADGALDLVTANIGGNDVSVLLGNGDGTFGASVDYPVGQGATAVAVGDFNADGKADLAVTNNFAEPSTISILLGKGDGTFDSEVEYGAVGSPQALEVGDFNADGVLDLAVANNGTNTVSVFLGNGDGSFAPQVEYEVGAKPAGIAVGDLNADGVPDMAVANQGDNSGDPPGKVSILLGNGDGTFAPSVDYDAGTRPTAIAIADFNSDGTPDLAVSNIWSSTLSILLGNGDGSFAPHVDHAVGTSPGEGRIAVADFNADGRPDVATANNGSGTVSVLLGIDGSGMGGGLADTRFKIDGANSWSSGAEVSVSGDGVHTVRYRSIDAAGNKEDTESCTVKIDATAPVSTVHGVDDVWHAWPQTVFVTAADAGSGMSGGAAAMEYDLDDAGWVSGDWLLIMDQGDHTLQVRATDAAGNVETPQTVHVRIDTVAPVTADNAGTAWHAAPFTLRLTPSDAGSGMSGGLATTAYSTDAGATWQTGTTLDFAARWKRGGGSGSFPVLVRSTDAVGNPETPHTVTVNIDNSSPTCTDDAPKTPVPGPVTVHFTGSDTGSGVAEIWYRLDGGDWTRGTQVAVSGIGAHTICYYAVDAAGNAQVGYNVCTFTLTTGGSGTSIASQSRMKLTVRHGIVRPRLRR